MTTVVVPPKKRLRVLQPTMSKASQLLACQWPWFRAVSEEPFATIQMAPSKTQPTVWAPEKTEETEDSGLYGTAVHEVIAARILAPPKKVNIPALVEQYQISDEGAFVTHTQEATEKLIRWMRKKNPWGIDLTKRAKIRVEMPVALDVLERKVRLIPHPDPVTHEYKAAAIGRELPGTADLVIDEIEGSNAQTGRSHAAGGSSLPDLILIDHKTGDGWDLPAQNDQLFALGLANKIRIGAKRVALGIFHTPIESMSSMYIDEIDASAMKDFAGRLRAAWRNIGTGQLRPGTHCAECPASTICPTQMGAIVQVETNTAMTIERAGEVAMKLRAFMATGEKIKKEVRAWIKVNGLPGANGTTHAVPQPNGKWVRVKRIEKEGFMVSTKALHEVLGLAPAEEIIAKLRAAGKLQSTSYDDIREVNEP